MGITREQIEAMTQEEKAVGLLQWMIRRETGVVRLAFGNWRLTDGTFQVPWWEHMLDNMDQEAIWNMELRTRPFSKGNFVGRPPYSRREIEEQAEKGWRPHPTKVQHGFYAESDQPDKIWIKEVSTWDFPTLVNHGAGRHTLKDLWNYWTSLPRITKPKGGSSKKGKEKSRQDRLQSYLESVRVAKQVLADNSLDTPGSLSDLRAAVRHVGKLLASKVFLSYTPQVVMELPTVPGHDSKGAMRERVVCDERITLSRNMLRQLPEVWEAICRFAPGEVVEVTSYYRCNVDIYWMAKVEDLEMVKLINAKLDKGPGTLGPDEPRSNEADAWESSGPVSTGPSEEEAKLLMTQGLLPPPQVAFACSALGADTRKKKRLQGHWFWFRCECGLVTSAVSSWEMVVKQHGVTRGGYACKHCQGYWRAGRGGSRMVQIQCSKNAVQLILDEPPDAPFTAWCNDRMEYYKRVEPNAAPRDARPTLVDRAACRLRFQGLASDAIWTVILANPEKEALEKIAKLGKQHEAQRLGQ